MIEYKSNTFGGALKNKILITEYSSGKDILALEPERLRATSRRAASRR